MRRPIERSNYRGLHLTGYSWLRRLPPTGDAERLGPLMDRAAGSSVRIRLPAEADLTVGVKPNDLITTTLDQRIPPILLVL